MSGNSSHFFVDVRVAWCQSGKYFWGNGRIHLRRYVMKSLKNWSWLVVLFAVLVAGCYGPEVRVGPTETGYEVTSSGISAKEWTPGAYRLNWCGVGEACASILRVDVGKHVTEISVERVFLPKSNVDLENVTAALQMQVKNTPEARRQVMADVRAAVPEDTTSKGYEKIITQEAIAGVYVDRIIPEMIIQTLKLYTVEQTLSDVVVIGKAVLKAVNEKLKESPIIITELSFSNGIGQVPDVVINAKRDLYAVDEEKARTIKALAAELSIEEKRQAFQVVRVANNMKNAKSAGIPYKEYVELMTRERVADAMEAMAATAEMFARTGTPFGFGMPAGALSPQPEG